MKKHTSTFLLTVILLLAFAMPAAGQSDAEYLLKVSKVMGTNLGSQINGTFKLGIDGDMGVVKSVEYRIDGMAIGTASESPFTLVFKTTDHPAGGHALTAVVTKSDGSSFETPARKFTFITSEDAGEVLNKVLLPILGITFGVVAVMMLMQFVLFRNRPLAQLEPGAPRNYGFKGGAICKNCGRPFALHMWSINLLPTVRYDRCDYCGKWGVQRSASMAALRMAEQLELAKSKPEVPVAEKTEEEKLKEMLDQSKYTR